MKTKLLKIYLEFIRKKIYVEKDEGFKIPMFSRLPPNYSYDRIMGNTIRSYIHYCAKESWLGEKSYVNWQSGQYSYAMKEVKDFKRKYERYSRKYWTPKAIMERNLKGER